MDYAYIIKNNIKKGYYTKAKAVTIMMGNNKASFKELKYLTDKLTLYNRMNYRKNITCKMDQK
jgi:hypothetical protein